jgi:cation diffusion facilitator family transporter
MMEPEKLKVRIAVLSVTSNTTLMVMKLAVGLSIGSVAIISEAIHSGFDLVAALIALFSVKTSSLPADTYHPFGHGKIENISGTVEALLILVAAIWIIVEAVRKLMNPQPIDALGWGVAVMLISAVVNAIVSEILFKVGRKTDSIALQADAWHLRTDVYTSAGVMGSLALIWLFEFLSPGSDFYWLDPVAAIAVALLILKAAYDLTIQSARDLLDVKLPKAEIDWITQLIIRHQPAVKGFHHLKTRKSGHFRFIEFHLKVDPQMSVEASHNITEDLTHMIKSRYPDASVMIHIEPCNGNCDEDCLEGCLLQTDKRIRDGMENGIVGMERRNEGMDAKQSGLD